MKKDLKQITPVHPHIMEKFRSGNTDGIPNFDSDLTKKVLRHFQPKTFEDLMLFYRITRSGIPELGPSIYKWVIQNNKSPQTIKYLHPMLEKHLSSTYGFLFYKEQMEEIITDLSGLSAEVARKLRNSLARNYKQKISFYFAMFLEGCRNNPDFQNGCREINRGNNETVSALWKLFEKQITSLQNRERIRLIVMKSYKTAVLNDNN